MAFNFYFKLKPFSEFWLYKKEVSIFTPERYLTFDISNMNSLWQKDPRIAPISPAPGVHVLYILSL